MPSFTSATNVRARVLMSNCNVASAVQVGGGPAQSHAFPAIWDTGATNTVITKKVAEACGLAATGVVTTHGVHGAQLVDTYLVDIKLPNNVVFKAIKVTQGILGDNADVLIGMDIIAMGDFAVTNKDGKTMFSFRVPSITHTDYVTIDQQREEAQRAAAQQHVGRKKEKRPKKHKSFGKHK